MSEAGDLVNKGKESMDRMNAAIEEIKRSFLGRHLQDRENH